MSMEAINYWEANTILIALNGSAIQLGEEPTNHNHAIYGEVSQGSALLSLEKAKELRDSLNRAIASFEQITSSARLLPLTDAIKEIGEWAKGDTNG